VPGPCSLAKCDPSNARCSICVHKEDLEVSLSELDIGTHKGVLGAGDVFLVQSTWGLLSLVGLAKLIEDEAPAVRLGGDKVEADLKGC
jgi:hypothetical protein